MGEPVFDRISAGPKYFGRNRAESLFRPKHFASEMPNFRTLAKNIGRNSDFAEFLYLPKQMKPLSVEHWLSRGSIFLILTKGDA